MLMIKSHISLQEQVIFFGLKLVFCNRVVPLSEFFRESLLNATSNTSTSKPHIKKLEKIRTRI